ncbi:MULTISPECIES: antibiotic biosynthesis monooxygenase [Ensifer]|jgi:autoinducer 2-degrading protein|uniref:Autoinducer-2 (AI-2) modifying protein LsrG n=1 Tax=Ensifer canadensis TaxID=555315 RepID=A0AAW4FN50_9HYPH|nr:MULTISPECIES: antibiotic biosynthesis monooxygenase [Ensifer]KQU83072.1 autoinducer-2 (AI-2) modifying protein LsrG [Ensifer sp. Root31]KQW59802.1 autoinducer-2 (AI-2) modifying protein LsrG [Ensifer sp. Root1252]KQW78584.1 autoinducer-2 (AI-2) modifying protein LsrG [Ensifer sp. Root127]KQY67090.1 autoinducer-2 (AI-2) modifying protein LsrG [Ensifer sp. Root142]KRC74004.1 autoinducer-2 (AI-2) modifying protein LsrG [Ensifer sp. Root231]
MLIQMVSIKVQEGHAAEFLQAFRINYEGTRREPGNLRFDVLRDPQDENTFLIYEVFQSAEALEDHRKTEHYKECVRMIDPILAGPRTKVYYNAEMADFLEKTA